MLFSAKVPDCSRRNDNQKLSRIPILKPLFEQKSYGPDEIIGVPVNDSIEH